MKQLIQLLLFIPLVFSCSSEGEELPGDTTSAVIWTGSNKTFTKADGADHTLINNQDVLTSNVSITRANNGVQIFNITKEDSDQTPLLPKLPLVINHNWNTLIQI